MYEVDSNTASLAASSASPSVRRVARAFNTPSWWYDIRGMFLVTFAYNSTIWKQVSFFEGNLSESHLEVPIGNGSVLDMCLKYRRLRKRPTPGVIAIDVSSAMIESATKAFRKRENVTVQYGDVGKLDFSDGQFQTVNIANGFHCFPDPGLALDEISRVLAPGDVATANVLLNPRGLAPLRWFANRINGWAMRKGILISPFDADQARTLFTEHGFEIIGDEVRGNTLYLTVKKPAA